MKSYAVREVFSTTHQAILHDAERCVSKLSDAYGNELRCHELARAVHAVLVSSDRWTSFSKLDVVSGMYFAVEHSWIRLCDLTHSQKYAILDVYCPGRIPQVQLIHEHFAISRGYVVEAQSRSNIKTKIVTQLINEMQE
jgi:hypothetical protein